MECRGISQETEVAASYRRSFAGPIKATAVSDTGEQGGVRLDGTSTRSVGLEDRRGNTRA